VEESQFPYQAANAGNISLSTWLPHDGGCRLCFNLLGRVENNDVGIDVQNAAAASKYSNSGGTWTVPQAAYSVLGSWQSALLVNSVTVNSAIGLPCGAGVNCGSLQRIVNPGSANTTDYFGYTNTSSRTASGGLWTFSGNLTVTGMATLTSSTLTAATPTVGAAQIGVGMTTAAPTSCGSLASAAGCWAINVAGTVHYIPYY
jgi:hypothetical protein